MNNPIRWKQRFENFKRAYQLMVKIIELGELNEIEKMALIQAFEFTFELSWKTMKDYLEEEGFSMDSPKSVIRQAFQSGYITEADVWMEALIKRNNTVHNYNSLVMEETIHFIRDSYYPLLRNWHDLFIIKSGL